MVVLFVSRKYRINCCVIQISLLDGYYLVNLRTNEPFLRVERNDSVTRASDS